MLALSFGSCILGELPYGFFLETLLLAPAIPASWLSPYTTLPPFVPGGDEERGYGSSSLALLPLTLMPFFQPILFS